jgi:acyl carrier protein phosphodiesterase
LNYLAHLYLSGNNPELMIGNFIADHVKGTSIKNYDEDIRAGIILHRAIDQFTDQHPVVEISKARLRPVFRKYAPVIVDIFYDHFLAKNWEQYHHQSLSVYAEQTYSLLLANDQLLPERTKYMLKYMIPQNWLLSYAEISGMEMALRGLSRRTRFESGMENSPKFLQQYYAEYESEFNLFFEELRLFVAAF